MVRVVIFKEKGFWNSLVSHGQQTTKTRAVFIVDKTPSLVDSACLLDFIQEMELCQVIKVLMVSRHQVLSLRFFVVVVEKKAI